MSAEQSSHLLSHQSWTTKYAPKTLKEVIGQSKSVAALKDFIVNFKYQKTKAALLYGPPGCGKTSSVYALANELDLEVLELNASDIRNNAAITSIVGAATKQRSLFFRQKLILVDEVDGLSGTKDRGGLQAMLKLISESSFPMVLVMEEPWDSKYTALRKATKLIEFSELDTNAIFELLSHICKKEGIKYEENTLKALSRRTGGDARAAVGDLYAIANSTKKLERESIDELGERNITEDMSSALLKVFKTTDAKIALSAYDNIDEDFDKVFLWMDENLPHEYTLPHDLSNAYEWMSKADVFNGRIRRNQQWRFIVYINNLLSVGIATAKKEKYKTTIEYKPTMRILKIWQANMKYAKRKAVAEKIGEKMHSSTKRAIQDTVPYLQEMFRHGKDKEKLKAIADELELDSEEVEWLRK